MIANTFASIPIWLAERPAPFNFCATLINNKPNCAASSTGFLKSHSFGGVFKRGSFHGIKPSVVLTGVIISFPSTLLVNFSTSTFVGSGFKTRLSKDSSIIGIPFDFFFASLIRCFAHYFLYVCMYVHIYICMYI